MGKNPGYYNFYIYWFGINYNVKGIGKDKAAAIVYNMNAYYLTPSSGYIDAKAYSIKAAGNLYGYGNFEQVETAKAWIAVGIGGAKGSCSDIYEMNDKKAHAVPIPLNKDLVARIGRSGEEDWYEFTTTDAAPKVKITLTNLPVDYDVKLYRFGNTDAESVEISSENSGKNNEAIIYNLNKSAQYYMQVYAKYNIDYDLINCYTFRVSTSKTNFPTPPKGLIGINTLNPATPISAATGNKARSVFEKNNADLVIYPNPVVNNKFDMQFNEDDNQTKEMVVVDVRGKVIFSKKINVSKGANKISIELPKMAKGMYMIKLDEKISKISVL